jgi:hypothetical protein
MIGPPVTRTPGGAALTQLDRRRDVRHWLLMPLRTLMASTIATGCLTLFVLAAVSDSPEFCATAGRHGCEEATLTWLAQGTVIFLAGWSLLWLVPWWRGLRPVRTTLTAAGGAWLVRLVSHIMMDSTTGLGGTQRRRRGFLPMVSAWPAG